MKTIGIDLGTTYSCVSYVDDFGVIRVIENAEGELATPSVVFFDPNGEMFVGTPAKEKGANDPENCCERVKNYVGDSFYSFTTENGKSYSAREICKFILQKLVRDAEAALGDEIEGAVITIPGYFGPDAKEDMFFTAQDVSLSNGEKLPLLFMETEPLAVVTAYNFFRRNEKEKTLLIYDLGGGTFDLTIVKIAFNGDDKKMRVITVAGDHLLGGKDWDCNLKDLFIWKFCEETGCDPNSMMQDSDLRSWISLRIEDAKKRLTKEDSVAFTISFEGQRTRVEVTRDEFEEATEGLLSETIALVDKMLSDKGLTMAQDIDEILLVGGATYMPQVTERLKREYGKPITIYEPDKIVAMGAALIADMKSKERKAKAE